MITTFKLNSIKQTTTSTYDCNVTVNDRLVSITILVDMVQLQVITDDVISKEERSAVIFNIRNMFC